MKYVQLSLVVLLVAGSTLKARNVQNFSTKKINIIKLGDTVTISPASGTDYMEILSGSHKYFKSSTKKLEVPISRMGGGANKQFILKAKKVTLENENTEVIYTFGPFLAMNNPPAMKNNRSRNNKSDNNSKVTTYKYRFKIIR